jgi:hypothetical protein
LPFNDRFRTPSDHLFVSIGENADLDFEEACEEIEGIPSGGKDFTLTHFSSFIVEKAENFLEGLLAGAALDLIYGFLDCGSLDLHHAELPG